jgi:penicillin V acylase-like amidase (Ntn superfamily)
MCTAITFQTKNHYFGRNLDLEISFGESVVVTPRHYHWHFRQAEDRDDSYGIIGMATLEDGMPLYYDATNEKGLSVAGLNFPGNAHYFEKAEAGKNGIASFELIPWILSQCQNLEEAKTCVENLTILDTRFNDRLPVSTLHWIVADATGSFVVESMDDGLHLYDNPVGALTNNPPFDVQLFGLNNYRQLTAKVPENHFAKGLDLDLYSRGMGAIGLPGDLSSASRFAKVVFTKLNSKCGTSEEESVSQFFHILGSVEQQRGCCDLGNDQYEYTIYSSCCNTDKGVYYYKTYDNSRITAVDMHHEDLDGTAYQSYPLLMGEDIRAQN